jgi:MFS family permease
MVDLIPLAIGSAIYPTLITLVILLLGRPNARALLTAYVAGALLVSVTAGLGIVAALNAGHVVGGSDRTVNPAVDIVAGLVALVLLYLLLTNRDRRLKERLGRRRREGEEQSEKKAPLSQRILERDSIALTFVLALFLNLPGMLYLVALKDIAAANEGTAVQVAEVIAFSLVMYALGEIPLIGYILAPERTQEVITRANDWLGEHSRQLAVLLCGAAGAFLLVRGIAHAI